MKIPIAVLKLHKIRAHASMRHALKGVHLARVDNTLWRAQATDGRRLLRIEWDPAICGETETKFEPIIIPHNALAFLDLWLGDNYLIDGPDTFIDVRINPYVVALCFVKWSETVPQCTFQPIVAEFPSTDDLFAQAEGITCTPAILDAKLLRELIETFDVHGDPMNETRKIRITCGGEGMTFMENVSPNGVRMAALHMPMGS